MFEIGEINVVKSHYLAWGDEGGVLISEAAVRGCG